MDKAFYNKLFKKKISSQKEESGNISASASFLELFDLSKECRLLDIGTNIGSLPASLYEQGYKSVFGIDISDEAILYGKQRHPLIENQLDIYNGKVIPFANQTFDVVTMFDVIEHVSNVEAF